MLDTVLVHAAELFDGNAAVIIDTAHQITERVHVRADQHGAGIVLAGQGHVETVTLVFKALDIQFRGDLAQRRIAELIEADGARRIDEFLQHAEQKIAIDTDFV